MREAEKKKERLEKEQEKAEELKRKALLERHFNMQGPKTQKRMKQNLKMADQFYKFKDRRTCSEKIKSVFRKKKYNK